MKKYLALLLLPLCLFLCACGANAKAENENPTGKFYTVAEAYVRGYLTREDVMSIAYYKNGGRSGNESVMSENYAPQPKAPEMLSAESEKTLKQLYFDNRWEDGRFEEAKKTLKEEYEITIKGYYGTYNGCIAVMTTDNYSAYTLACWTDTVADVNIYYGDGNSILVWTDKEEVNLNSQYYSLETAYNQGLLSKDDLKSIAAIYNGETECTQTLDSRIEMLIRMCEVKRLRDEQNFYAHIDRVKVVKFYGKYTNCYIVSTAYISIGYQDDEIQDEAINEWFYIDGIGFHKTDHYGIEAWIINI